MPAGARGITQVIADLVAQPTPHPADTMRPPCDHSSHASANS